VSLNKPVRNETEYVIYIQDLHSNDTWQGKDVTLPQVLPSTHIMHALRDQNLSGSFLFDVAAGCRRIRELFRQERHV